MVVESHRLLVETKGNCHVIDITSMVAQSLTKGRVRDGVVTVFVIGSTASITTTEFEPGLVQRDLRESMERIAPEDGDYLHEATWNDDNGHSHVRASLMGPSIAVPLVHGKLTLGTWQQLVLIDFDTRPRKREIVVQVLGE